MSNLERRLNDLEASLSSMRVQFVSFVSRLNNRVNLLERELRRVQGQVNLSVRNVPANRFIPDDEVVVPIHQPMVALENLLNIPGRVVNPFVSTTPQMRESRESSVSDRSTNSVNDESITTESIDVDNDDASSSD